MKWIAGWWYRVPAHGFRSERGAATAEYALILALVVVVLIGTLTTLGDALTDKLAEVVADLQN